MSVTPEETVATPVCQPNFQDRPDLAELLKATADTMAAVRKATERLEGEIAAMRSAPRRGAAPKAA